MASLFSKLTKFAASPQGRAAIAKAKAAANDPKNRQKLDDLVGKVKDRAAGSVPPRTDPPRTDPPRTDPPRTDQQPTEPPGSPGPLTPPAG